HRRTEPGAQGHRPIRLRLGRLGRRRGDRPARPERGRGARHLVEEGRAAGEGGVGRDFSQKREEPQGMLALRLKGLKLFARKPMPNWGSDLSGIDFDHIKYFVRSTEKQAASWDDLPADIKSTYDKLGIPEAEKQRLIAGVAAQYE